MAKAKYDDADLLLRLYDLRREALLRKARNWFLSQFQAYNWEDKIRKYPPGSEEERFSRMVISYWDMVAGLVNNGLIHEELFFQTTGEHIRVWERVKPWIEIARTEINPLMYRNLEELVDRQQKWHEKRISKYTKGRKTRPSKKKKTIKRKKR